MCGPESLWRLHALIVKRSFENSTLCTFWHIASPIALFLSRIEHQPLLALVQDCGALRAHEEFCAVIRMLENPIRLWALWNHATSATIA